jgi:hypothetical protein
MTNVTPTFGSNGSEGSTRFERLNYCNSAWRNAPAASGACAGSGIAFRTHLSILPARWSPGAHQLRSEMIAACDASAPEHVSRATHSQAQKDTREQQEEVVHCWTRTLEWQVPWWCEFQVAVTYLWITIQPDLRYRTRSNTRERRRNSDVNTPLPYEMNVSSARDGKTSCRAVHRLRCNTQKRGAFASKAPMLPESERGG